jgi:hypothetical protein
VTLDLVKARIARSIAMVVVGMDHHRHEIGIVEGRSRAIEGGLVEAPGRLPLLPEEPADGPPMLREAEPPARYCVVANGDKGSRVLIPSRN